MPISVQVPKHLEAAAQTGFLVALRETTPDYRRIATEIMMDSKTVDLVDLGAAPMPTNSRIGFTWQDFIEKTVQIQPDDWDITVGLSWNAYQDDRTGTLNTRVRSAATNYAKHMSKLCFQALNGGDGSTYGLCYDGNEFFDASHIDSGAKYQTAQGNLGTSALDFDAYEAANIAMRGFVNDQGEYTDLIPNLLVVNQANERKAMNIHRNPSVYDNANEEQNPYVDREVIVTPWFDSTAWVLVAADETSKPVILAIRERPSLQSSWFDPDGPDGGMFMFKFYARYNVAFGDWRTAYMGKT